jgi:hypothetical protein
MKKINGGGIIISKASVKGSPQHGVGTKKDSPIGNDVTAG